MKRTRLVAIILLLLSISAPAWSSGGGGRPAASRPAVAKFTAKIVFVEDGDTVVGLTPSREELRVRLAGIDAPELSHGMCKPGQEWGPQSKQRLEKLVLGKELVLRCYEYDRYELSICDVDLPSGGTASSVLVAEGHAWANRVGTGTTPITEVLAAETRAKAAGLGVWAEKAPTAPWIWRHTEWRSPGTGLASGLPHRCVGPGSRR